MARAAVLVPVGGAPTPSPVSARFMASSGVVGASPWIKSVVPGGYGSLVSDTGDDVCGPAAVDVGVLGLFPSNKPRTGGFGVIGRRGPIRIDCSRAVDRG